MSSSTVRVWMIDCWILGIVSGQAMGICRNGISGTTRTFIFIWIETICDPICTSWEFYFTNNLYFLLWLICSAKSRRRRLRDGQRLVVIGLNAQSRHLVALGRHAPRQRCHDDLFPHQGEVGHYNCRSQTLCYSCCTESRHYRTPSPRSVSTKSNQNCMFAELHASLSTCDAIVSFYGYLQSIGKNAFNVVSFRV